MGTAKRRALVVVDMQNDFIYGPLGNDMCRAAVPEVCRQVKEGGYDSIYVTLDTHYEGYHSTQEGRILPVEHCIEGTPGWELAEDVKAAIVASGADVEYVRKSAFGSLDLADRIKRECAEDASVDFVGVCTDICVVSNVLILKAACPEMEVSVVARCCAGTTREKHEAALATMGSCQARIVWR
ncbi:MAG: cysteine hydrolase [Candidatus Methanomethylophilaceae archaeon]|nr:cysteine hydrolase [Candidatus Methanomethylophilaceae archaeon]